MVIRAMEVGLTTEATTVETLTTIPTPSQTVLAPTNQTTQTAGSKTIILQQEETLETSTPSAGCHGFVPSTFSISRLTFQQQLLGKELPMVTTLQQEPSCGS